MPFRPLARVSLPGLAAVLVALLAACASSDSVAPSHEPPSALDAVSALTSTVPVGSVIPGGIVVRVRDAAGRPVEGATVGFAVTLGNGTTNPRVAVTDAKGEATTVWTL